MNDAKLVHMANQIALNLQALPEEAAVQAIAEHLKSFWTPAMRQALLAHLAQGTKDLAPLCERAVERLR
jgi:formate dehydrogenase subunit delta